jgi:adenosine deaminase
MLKYLLMRDLCVSIHSDDPAYCGGYISENYSAAQQALNLDSEEICKLAANAIEA